MCTGHIRTRVLCAVAAAARCLSRRFAVLRETLLSAERGEWDVRTTHTHTHTRGRRPLTPSRPRAGQLAKVVRWHHTHLIRRRPRRRALISSDQCDDEAENELQAAIVRLVDPGPAGHTYSRSAFYLKSLYFLFNSFPSQARRHYLTRHPFCFIFPNFLLSLLSLVHACVCVLSNGLPVLAPK